MEWGKGRGKGEMEGEIGVYPGGAKGREEGQNRGGWRRVSVSCLILDNSLYTIELSATQIGYEMLFLQFPQINMHFLQLTWAMEAAQHRKVVWEQEMELKWLAARKSSRSGRLSSSIRQNSRRLYTLVHRWEIL